MLSETDQTELLRLARTTLESYLSGQGIPVYQSENPGLCSRSGAFVSLHCGEELRGCIGHLSGESELYRTVQRCAISAATEDSRFMPVCREELSGLTIEISVLTPMERVDSVEEIEVGRHGLLITRGLHRGLLLPQVATQYGWDRATFLNQTCRKAGLPEAAWKDPATIIQRFEAKVFSDQLLGDR